MGVAAAMHEVACDTWVWGCLIAYSFIWPHIAYIYASQVCDSLITGQRQLLFDSFCGGLWVAAMSFNLVPSLVVMTMLAMNNMAAGGLRLLTVGLGVQVISTGLWVSILGWEPNFHSSLDVILASAPFLVIHPLIVGAMAYQFASRLHLQKCSLQQISRIDNLTGLYNRGYWQLRASEEFDRCTRSHRKSVLIMLDADYFKSINDTYGHSIGDEVISGLGEILRRQSRTIDICGRFGGEEFVIVLPDTTLAAAKKIAERLRSSVANELIGGQTPVQCTISLGLAEFDQSMKTFEDWINGADSALYDAKKRGRNCFCEYTPVKKLRVAFGSNMQVAKHVPKHLPKHLPKHVPKHD